MVFPFSGECFVKPENYEERTGTFMRYLPLTEIQEGMFLARSIIREDGRPLLARGTKLTKGYLKKLNAKGYPFLFVGNRPEDLEFQGAISEQTFSQALGVVRELFLRVAKRKNLDFRALLEVAEFMVDEIVEKPVLYNIIDLHNHNQNIYVHSINVGTIATIMGKNLGLSRKNLRELATGALLHDIGKMCITKPLLKKGQLVEEEDQEMRAHPRYGFELIRDYPGVSLLAAHVAYQHHEREDGSGYPRALAGHQIHLYAKIAMVADAYEVMTSGRSDHRTLWSHEALTQLALDAAAKYDLNMIMLLAGSVALYPVGSIVLLNNLEVGMVTDVTPEHLKIEFLTGEDQGKEVLLVTDSLLKIERRLS
jgi:putative nucleotidyltransferase with HDIG domain